jgi:hypothetical protein
MRAREFIVENAVGKLNKHHQEATRGLNVFAKRIDTYDKLYDLNRVMMAVASSDGINPIEMDSESWVGKHNTAHAYTEEEQNMLKLAYKAAGVEYKDLNDGNLNSEELASTNTDSPVVAFKGYKRK